MELSELLVIWAKMSDDGEEQHYPLLYHMLDTVAVCREMWERCLHKSARQFLANALQVDEIEALKWISFWVGLHDIGKASPDFQCKSKATTHKLEVLGFKFNRKPGTYHGFASTCILQTMFHDVLSPEIALKIPVAIGGHHGVFPRSSDLQATRRYLSEERWNDARVELYNLMVSLCDIQNVPVPEGHPQNPFYMTLAGLTSVVDWIASNEDFFPYQVQHDVSSHLDYAKDKSLAALNKLGWTGWSPAQNTVQFGDLFKTNEGNPMEPRPLQQEVRGLSEECCNQPGLVIIEAPMGEGKTEAAIYLADSWVANLQQKGYYFALPTMATSDQMFGRVEKYLGNRYPGERVNVMLLHSHASLSEEFKILKDNFEAQNVNADGKDSNYDNASAGVVASEWFTYRKRGLLAPFGVGTIDQALLAVLQTRHVFVRLFGLANKTVIIDEVHAYDAYMSALLERLLEWLAALGSSVVLLSATLPRERKNKLLFAYQRGISGLENIPEVIDDAIYPRISWSIGSEVRAKTIETPDSKKRLQVQWVDGAIPEGDGEFILGRSLREKLKNGGCAAVICNTVDRAQKVYNSLKKYFLGKDADDGYAELDMLHARFLYGDRKVREERTLLRFGKPGSKVKCSDSVKREVKRPPKAILVATQIVEQSLDLDFDLMITEMAPVDLILQRAGRLHRHQRERPENLKSPELWVCEPEKRDGVPFFGDGTEAVYDYHVLLRSWLAINEYAGKKPIEIPDDVEALIEAVYDEKRECPAVLSEALKVKWEESREKLFEDLNYEKGEAENRYIKWPGFGGHLGRIVSDPREEDDPTIHPAHQALTRLTGLTANVICLYGTDIKAFWDKKQEEPLDLNLTPNNEVIKKLLEHSVSVARIGLCEAIIHDDKNTLPIAWEKTALLRHHRILFFNEQGICLYGNFQISLDDESGLVIEKME